MRGRKSICYHHEKSNLKRRISIPPLQVRRALSGGYGGCLCQWELKAPTDRSQSDCVHEQVAKADCECPLYAQKRENENLRFRTFLKCNADEEKLDRQFKSVPLEKVMAMENSMYYTIRKRRGIWR